MLTAWPGHRPDRHVDRARDVAESLGRSLVTEVLGGGAGIEEGDIGGGEEGPDVGRGQAHPGLCTWGEPGGRRWGDGARDGPTLLGPGRKAAVEDAHGLQPVHTETPPDPGREQADAVVVDHDAGAIPDSGQGQRASDPLWPGQEQRVATFGEVGEVRPPVDVDRAGHVARRPDRVGTAVGPPADVEDSHLGPAELVGQPIRRREQLRAGEAAGRPRPLESASAGMRRHHRYHRGVVAPFLPDDEKLAAIREALPALGAGIYLNTGSVGPLPAETAAAMAEIVDYELRIGRAHVDYWDAFLERKGEARAAVAAVLGADVGEIALVHSTTQAMNAAVWSTDLRPGDRIVTTQAEHAGGLGPVHAVAARFRARIVVADVGAGADEDRILEAFDAAIAPGTRFVALSHVLWTTGACLPIQRIAALAHDRGAIVIVDGAQAAGAIPVSVSGLGVDFYAVSGQKWLLGPEGTGALWCAPGVVGTAQPSNATTFTYERLTPTEAVPWPDARRFDDTGHYRPGVTGLARSCGWLSMYIGLPWIHSRGQALARSAADRLAAIPGVELLTPRDRMATLVSFRVRGWDAPSALDEIAARTFTIARTIPALDAIRLSVGFFTTSEEIERVATAVELLAAHTPTSLPQRPRLTVLGIGG
jgi:L-cysteine/cystine lyase